MKETPILMCGEMVRASLRQIDPKTQTRRVFKDTVSADCVGFRQFRTDGPGLWRQMFQSGLNEMPKGWTHKCPYGMPGDRLWVKETFGCLGRSPKDGPPTKGDEKTTCYRATDSVVPHLIKWRPSIFMPRWASRITLEIVSVRVERVQEISEADAVAEGIELTEVVRGHRVWHASHRAAYASLWQVINGPGSWEANPVVWVVEFKRIETGGTK